MKSLRRLCVALVALAMMLAFPYTGFAQTVADPGAGYNLQLEYRYTAGQEGSLAVPNEITRFGRGYHLIDRAPAVLESTLPATRTYTYKLDGVISQDEMASMDIPSNVTLTPTSAVVERMVDEEVDIPGMPANDVDLIPLTRDFQVRSATSSTGTATATLDRAAVQFDVEKVDPKFPDLPATYVAHVTYRGLETYEEGGFYQANATYDTVDDLDGVPQYIVVATYAPDNPPANTGGGTTGGGTTNPPANTEANNPPTDTGQAVVIPPADQPTSPPTNTTPGNDNNPGGGGTGTTIPSEELPKAPPNASSFQFWMLIPTFVAVALVLFCLWLIKRDRDRAREREENREARRKAAMRAAGLIDYD